MLIPCLSANAIHTPSRTHLNLLWISLIHIFRHPAKQAKQSKEIPDLAPQGHDPIIQNANYTYTIHDPISISISIFPSLNP
jgi:hypothetical protein